MSKYVIINAEAIQQRIEELEKQMNEYISHASKTGDYDYQFEDRLDELKQVLSQSTPLIPEIEKAYKKAFTEGVIFGLHTEYKYKTSQDYISNLKLDI